MRVTRRRTALPRSRVRSWPLAGAFLAGLAASAAIAQEVETPEVLPPGEGREETFYACTACHGSRIVTQQGMSRERWDATIDWMIERHAMPPPDPAERALILDYLAANFPGRQQRRGPANPFLK